MLARTTRAVLGLAGFAGLVAAGFVAAMRSRYPPARRLVRHTDWVSKILAAGTATVEHEGETVHVDTPELVGRDRVETTSSPGERRVQRLFGIDEFLLLHRAGPDSGPRAPAAVADRP